MGRAAAPLSMADSLPIAAVIYNCIWFEEVAMAFLYLETHGGRPWRPWWEAVEAMAFLYLETHGGRPFSLGERAFLQNPNGDDPPALCL